MLPGYRAAQPRSPNTHLHPLSAAQAVRCPISESREKPPAFLHAKARQRNLWSVLQLVRTPTCEAVSCVPDVSTSPWLQSGKVAVESVPHT